ncbi:MAG: TetR/AcrR family transcriptional regulator [Bosea sp. (in: a-proteobacteria)]|uniref:TetR/AcrR family transcriptional regulator n=1 Tax=Bosea sp. (in: a-proteobacteria) TaxID=1871050 RepID=UPI0027358F95|nr:TetR/AcrR family transcriptional regulator [Bosea sp. (in: a-proteobacteria)]MDP3255307.1 TetR/AcrR family transcriptional regulator [Bosea sp. (in: a-proteobacteria)]MDP3320478.1 TetR/AcrR family transcriptional regulator [Bosea sp. (in: a-proteobacteria)]
MSQAAEGRPGTKARNRRVAGADPEKRRQILDGAQAIFHAQGFDAASMNEIAAAAGVSKGTLYVYFEDKEHLFVALIEREREKHRQHMDDALAEHPDLSQALAGFGVNLVRLLTDPFSLSAHRIVLGVAERMPDLGRAFFERGPLLGGQRLAAFLNDRISAGDVAIEDTTLAAGQFIDLCQSTLLRPRLFNAERRPPTDAEITHVVDAAVAMFLARYARPVG